VSVLDITRAISMTAIALKNLIVWLESLDIYIRFPISANGGCGSVSSHCPGHPPAQHPGSHG
jgi:hypothetical protein